MDKVQHFEIPADDVARARKFYETVFGWNTMPFPMPGMEYIGLHTGPVDEKNMCKEVNFINGGMFKRGGQFLAQGPVIAVTTADIAATIEKLKSMGGSTVGETMNISGMGLYQYAKDTEGNMIGIWQELRKQ